SRVGSIPEAVVDGVTGLLANPGDPQDLGAKLQRLLADADLRRRMGQAARRHAENAFDWRDVARDYEATYARARGGGGARVPTRDEARAWTRHGVPGLAPRPRRL
ncbi:MAG TPA: glycosyltransferase, partial [Candidatus Thermoplasmatota archaeon]|nr:glycosyltransferase [Candidatus Thermoplasmatota archaeon]